MAEKLTQAIKESFQDLGATAGADPLDPSTQYGPLIDKAQFDRVHGYINEADLTHSTARWHSA
jgi:aldehyde dehydrogenase (NAD+)